MIDKYEYVLIVNKKNNTIKSELIKVSNIKLSTKLTTYKILYPKQTKLNIILLIQDGIFCKNDKKSTLKSTDNTSYLTSLLQKCFRNQYVSNTLAETITKLHYSAGYNLPDQHFARVSGPRQLFWRSYISVIEDICAFSTEKYIDLLDLFALSLVCSIDPYISLNNKLLEYVQESMIKVQKIKTHWRWGKYSASGEIPLLKQSNDHISRIQNSMILGLTLQPMMRGDFNMLLKCYDFLNKDSSIIQNIDLEHDDKLSIESDDHDIVLETKMRGLDMHCFPYILIQFQGSLPFIPTKNETLQNLSHFIWDNSSGYNTRVDYDTTNKPFNKKKVLMLRTLLDIQYITTTKPSYIKNYDWILNNWVPKLIITDKNKINKSDSRLAFLLIFGKKHKINKKIKGLQYDVILAGTYESPCKVKRSIDKNKTIYVEDEEKNIVQIEFVKQFKEENHIFDFSKVSAPIGYKWNFSGKEKLDIVSSNTNNLQFYVGKIKLNPFDGHSLISPINKYQINKLEDLPEELLDNLNIIFYNDYGEIFELLLDFFAIGKNRYDLKDFRIFDWAKLAKNIPVQILLYSVSRILMAQNDELQIGPVDRSGNKTHNSISYIYEGVIWRLVIAMYLLYPNVFIPLSPYKYAINKNTFGYHHMLETFKILTTDKVNIANKSNTIPQIISKLWDHQKSSIDKIVYGMTIENKKGFGDASDVGSGKTLTALGVVVKLAKFYKTTKLTSNSGFLVMLPTEKLYDTWKTEIKKHTIGFTIIEQSASGTLSDTITESSIVITTMGRCREHPIIHQWLLVIIDECLTVQNKEALQTEEAWRQSSYSHFGILMLSATFFRSRFDKMLYMINMLNTQLPPTMEYIDCILCETIVCNLNKTDRKWITNIDYTVLEKPIMDQYNQLALKYKEIGFEKVYHTLIKFIRDNVDYVEIFKNSLNKILKKRPNAKILIYASSKKEADMVAQIDKTIGRYPEKKTHTVVSYAEATYGLNDLIVFDTILTRPPESDKLPQMKGRLDRPNQKENILHIEYILLKDTIEEANLYKLEISNNFYGNHIMPLAEFYEFAVLLKNNFNI